MKAPTCTEEGYTTHLCVGCRDSYKDGETNALGHDWDEWMQTKPPTCEEKGEEQRICKRKGCGAVEKRDVDALGHTEVIDKTVEPDCTHTGLTEGKHCSVCDAVLVAQTVVDAKGHTEVTDEAVKPDCTHTGLTEGKHCSVCDAVLVAQTVVRAKGHNEAASVKENEKAAQVGVAGSYDEVIYCMDCGTELGRRTVTTDPLPEPKPEPKPLPRPDPEPEPVPVMNTASKLIEIFDMGDRIKIIFYSDGTFKVHMGNGAVENGTYRNETGRLVLYCATGAVIVDDDGSFTYVSPGDFEVEYDFRISPQDKQTLLDAAK